LPGFFFGLVGIFSSSSAASGSSISSVTLFVSFLTGFLTGLVSSSSSSSAASILVLPPFFLAALAAHLATYFLTVSNSSVYEFTFLVISSNSSSSTFSVFFTGFLDSFLTALSFNSEILSSISSDSVLPDIFSSFSITFSSYY